METIETATAVTTRAATAPAPSAAEVKRFLEIWSSGLYAKEDLLNRPQEIFTAHRLNFDPALVRTLYESKFLRGKSGKFDTLPPAFDDFREYIHTKIRWRENIRLGAAPSNPVFRAFRERQIQRCQIELGTEQNTAIVHTPLVFEMTRGCSVKCWFCALDAPPLTAVYEYTPDNVQFLRDVLSVAKEVVGTGSRWASSYWGTDPLDNPHQEKFNDEFLDIFGMYPQTTTAIPLRDVERVRTLLKDSHAKGCYVNRFSVRTAAQLRGIHAAFSAEELLYTELIMQQLESDSVKARAGRLIHFAQDLPKLANRDEDKLVAMLHERDPELAAKATAILINLPGSTGAVVRANGNGEATEEFNVAINVPGTTSCLTGFKINMVDRTVELLSPCPATEQWRLGHIVFEEGRFETAADLRTLMLGMIERNMTREVTPEMPVYFSPRMKYFEEDDGFKLATVFGSVACRDTTRAPYLKHLGAMIREGTNCAGDVALQCFYLFGMPEIYTLGNIRNLFNHGMLTEEPRPVLQA